MATFKILYLKPNETHYREMLAYSKNANTCCEAFKKEEGEDTAIRDISLVAKNDWAVRKLDLTTSATARSLGKEDE